MASIEENARFLSRNQITGAGHQAGRQGAIDAAKGILQGAIDELITILGEAEAYEIAQGRVDQICRHKPQEGSAWAKKKG